MTEAMDRTAADERSRVTASDKVDGYAATIASIEPDIHPIDPGAFYASAAISLRRIAEASESIDENLEIMSSQMEGIISRLERIANR